VRHSNKSLHEICELGKITRGILRGTLGMIRHLLASEVRLTQWCVKINLVP
jgi:hypothetical protein